MAEGDGIEEAPSMDPETTCSICYAEFLDAEDLVIHVQQVHWTESCRSCHFCPSVYRCLDDYALHIKNTHLMSLKACKHCQRIYDDFDLLRKHEKLHSNQQRGKKLFCSHCVKTFDYTQDLADHEFKYHNDGRDGVFLNEIFPLLTGQLNIKAITFITSLRETAAYICPCCMFTVNDPNEYINHTKINKCQTIVCSKCCNVYRDKKGLLRHLQSHKECFLDTKTKDLIKQCKKCEKNIAIKRYKEHLKTCKPIKCHVCNLVMESMYALSQHQSENHPMTIQMKTCRFCHKEFVGSVALQRHFNRKHANEVHLYKYKCVHCEDMYFKHPQNLFGHFFSKHHDIEPYCCKICNMKFRLRKKLTIHIKLVHNSVGFVEFDENYNVFFTDTKSDNPFTPTCLFPELMPGESQRVDQTDNEPDIDAPTDFQTDAPTDVPTDCQTDAEETKPKTQRKPLKIRYKEEKSKRNQAAQLQSDTNMSEAQTDKENGNVKKKSIPKRTRGQKLRERTIKKQVFHEDKIETDSDDEPLVKIKRKSMSNANFQSKANMSKKDRLTCNICKKYCYTLLNYNYHMSLHFKNEVKKCVKCSEEFSSKTDLQKHMIKNHSSSRLTQTLKNLLERRKQAKNGTLPELTTAEKFQKTIKRAKSGISNALAVIKEVKEDLSVKKFIEEFTPEETNKDQEGTNKAKEKKSVEILSSVSVSRVNYNNNYKKPPAIKMVKFKPERKLPAVTKLALPVRFKEVPSEKPHITCRVVHQTETPNYEEVTGYYEVGDDNVNHYEDNVNDYEESEEQSEPKMIVPEMAEEVLLETQEQPQKRMTIPHQIVIPELPQSIKHEIQIAHLLPEAPYYKIVKMSDVMKDTETQEENSGIKNENEDVELPAGTKLVNVNPLAHLLGNTKVEDIFGPKYTPKRSKKPVKTPNFQQAIAKALARLEKPEPGFTKKKRNYKKKNDDNDASVVVEQ